METNIEDIKASLKALGLEPGATLEDVHVAFRNLARACHPDVAGREGAARFQEITSAYSLLKGLSPEQLAAEEAKEAEPSSTGQGRTTLFDWYQKRRREQLGETVKKAEPSSRRPSPLARRVDRVLDQYEREVSRLQERTTQETDLEQVKGLLLRLRSSKPEVRRLALSRLGTLANDERISDALGKLLCRETVDEETARLLSSLPMTPDTLDRLAHAAANHAANLPNSLLTNLLGLRERKGINDAPLMERFLLSASTDGAALLLRSWPKGKPPSDAALRQLLASEDPQALVHLLTAIKQLFPQVTPRHKKRLTELLRHPAPTVRLWCQTLLGDKA
ncbi:MAG: DnaJ domain-containing protein [Synergistaceae bacterium]|nr:DnaJ domain-containing protein [Synergistaceae bacterium]